MNDLDLGKLVARMDNLEKTTDTRHKENKEDIASIQKKLDILVNKFSEAKGGWFVLSVLGATIIGLGALVFELFNLKHGS